MSQPAANADTAAAPRRPTVRCREIEQGDLAQVVSLLCEGFPLRSAHYWAKGLDELSRRALPAGFPRYGFLLDAGQGPVGILLMIYLPPSPGRFEGNRCNVSSWYVREGYRPYAIHLMRSVRRVPDVTFVNISASPTVFKIIHAQGFQRYTEGMFACLPWLGLQRSVRVRRLRPGGPNALVEGMPDAGLLIDHADRAIVLIAGAGDARAPFIFVRRSIKRSPRIVAQLAYCRAPSDFVALAGPVGRHLLLREGLPVVACDASAPLPGLVGVYLDNYKPKYFLGASPPPTDDLAYTEAMVFGI